MADDKLVEGLYIREKQTKYSPIINVGITPNFIKFYEENKDEKGNLNIDFKKMKEPKDNGVTHYSTINEWKKPETENPL